MKYKLLIAAILVCSALFVAGQCPSYTTTNTQTGTCNEAAGNRTLTGDLTVNGNLTINGDFTVAGGLVVNGTLTVTGDIIAFSGGSITIADGGTIDIADDFRPNSGLSSFFTLTVEDGGTLLVGDDFDGTHLSGVTVQDGGNVDVGGDYTTGVGTTTVFDGDVNVDGNFTNESFLGEDAVLEGDGNLTVGGTYTNQGNDDEFNGMFNGAPLPVELLSFYGESSENQVVLNWSTASEVNNEGFHIERSGDGINFISIGFVGGNGTTSELHEYEFIDRKPLSDRAYYRFKQVDYDGQFEYSPIVMVDQNPEPSQLEVYPNPTHGSIQIMNPLSAFQLYDPSGKLLLNIQNTTRVEAERMISDRLQENPAGIYTLKATLGERVDQIRLVKK